MGLMKLIKLRQQEDLLKKQTKQWREVIYQSCSLQAKEIAKAQTEKNMNLVNHQQQFFNRRLRNYFQGLKDSQTKLQLVRQEIQEYQNSPLVKTLKFIDFYGVIIILSVTIAGILGLLTQL